MLWSHSTNTNSRSNRNAAPTSMPHQWLWCWKALRGGINQGLTTSNYTTKTCTKVVTDPRIQTTPNTTIMYLLADVKVNTSYSLIVTMLNLKVEVFASTIKRGEGIPSSNAHVVGALMW
eukprot:m.107095 g.107095  ORF g.107095 m.107095 type:complete len:119 (-) comp15304_c0_seq87:2403-2759(-)